MRAKHLGRALKQMAEEGAARVFKPRSGADWIVGVVGSLQFDVVAQRLRDEYKVDAIYEHISVTTARWVSSDDAVKWDTFNKKCYDNLALDGGDNLTYVAPTGVNLQLAMERHPDIQFQQTREH